MPHFEHEIGPFGWLLRFLRESYIDLVRTRMHILGRGSVFQPIGIGTNQSERLLIERELNALRIGR